MPLSTQLYAQIKLHLPGLGVAALIAMAATLVATLQGGPQLLYALMFGIAFHFLWDDPRIRPGLDWCARTVMRLGVALLGLRITLDQVTALGWSTGLIIVLSIVSTVLFAYWLGSKLSMNAAFSVLCGAAVGICGASAALAVAAVLPHDKDSDRDTLTVVVTVTVLSTLAMIAYPLIARALQLSPDHAGVLLGATIHDVAQVVGAGYTLGKQAGDIATIVKLSRVAMLVFVVMIVSALFHKGRIRTQVWQEHAASGAATTSVPVQAAVNHHRMRVSQLVPWFLWLFMTFVMLHSLSWLPHFIEAPLSDFSRVCLVWAIAALGVKTSFAKLKAVGWRPFTLLVAVTFWLLIFVLVMLEVF